MDGWNACCVSWLITITGLRNVADSIPDGLPCSVLGDWWCLYTCTITRIRNNSSSKTEDSKFLLCLLFYSHFSCFTKIRISHRFSPRVLFPEPHSNRHLMITLSVNHSNPFVIRNTKSSPFRVEIHWISSSVRSETRTRDVMKCVDCIHFAAALSFNRPLNQFAVNTLFLLEI